MDDKKSSEDNTFHKLNDNEDSTSNNEIAEPSTSHNHSTPNEDEESLAGQIEVIEHMIKVDKSECKKIKMPIKLPRKPELQVTCSEIEVVGDDTSMKKQQHIDCECEPNVAGAAVPTVISFNAPPPINEASGKGQTESSHMNVDKVHEQVVIKKSSSEIRVCRPNSMPSENESSTTKIRLQTAPVKKSVNLTRTNRSLKLPEIPNLNLKSRGSFSRENSMRSSGTIVQKSDFKTTKYSDMIPKLKTATVSDSKTYFKRPSMIPKPSRPNSSHQRLTENSNSNMEKRDKNQSNVSRLDKYGSLNKLKYPNERSVSNTIIDSGTNNKTMSTRMTGLQERLKATTSMLRKKMENDNDNKIDAKKQRISSSHQQTPKNIPEKSSSATLRNLYKNIYQMKETALNLSSATALRNQKEYVEKLLKNISEIQNIADKLSENDKVVGTNESRNREHNKPSCSSKDATIQSNTMKDNKIYIKFLQAKEKQSDKKKQIAITSELSDDVTGPSLITDLNDVEPHVEAQAKADKNLIEKDSMDGVFIPSLEPPNHIEEEEESNGLDITITFPEFNQLLSEQDESHLSVRLSDISAEALRKLKRCPKDFTLRMDFVQGKVLFQSGKAPANNFLISPELKFVENMMEENKSDIISIKPSTECSFASQLISVENIKDCSVSYKSLKSTDSELFNVVNLPLLFRNPSLNPVTRSCIAFKNDNIISMAILARQFFQSMPQIPSLTNIYEDKFLENFNKAECLPYDRLTWVEEDVENFDVTTIPDDSPYGYILEVDLNTRERASLYID